MNTLLKYKKYILPVGFVIAGILIGTLIGRKSSNQQSSASPNQQITEPAHQHISDAQHQIWTCSMHPQIRMDKEGDCPICGMDLIPLQNNQATIDEDAIEMSEAAMKLAEVQTAVVTRGAASREVLLYGKIQVDERQLQSQAAHVPGRIEKLMVNVTGETVKSGQLIATIYSPELVTAQKELLEAKSMKDKYPSLLEAAREKLRNWKLSDKQISEIESSGKIAQTFNLYANTSGVITNRKVSEGDYVQKGTVLFEVANFGQIWGVFDAYESDLPWISMNQEVEFTAQAVPGKTFKGKVSFIDPVIDPATRTARVRVSLGNPGLQLKPEMFINGAVKSTMKGSGKDLIIPQSAVLWTGKRSVVYVRIREAEHPTFKMREITLGPAMKETYLVQDGLSEGDEIVVNGTFSVDAAAQLAGKTSMMNTSGEKMNVAHNHSEMNMSKTNDEHLSFKVGGNCEMCKDRIEKAAKAVTGVTKANWDMNTQVLHLDITKGADVNKIHASIAASGHDTEKTKAPDNIYKKLPECCLYERLTVNQSSSVKPEHAMFKVAGNCEMCKDRIEKAAKTVKGVVSAEWSAEQQVLHLGYNKGVTSVETVQKAVASAGHDTEKYKASDAVYNKLPECCLYERLK